jgi:hypothetical protein
MLDSIRNKIWHRVKYVITPLNCQNCAHANKDAWIEDDNKGICTYLVGLPFMILKEGICKYHSAFNGSNIKHSV